MFLAGYGSSWSQEASHARAVVEATSDAIRHEGLALRKKNERAHTTELWATLELLAPSVDANKGHPGYRSKALRGRTKEELLKDVMHAVRLAQGRQDDLDLGKSECTSPRKLCALWNSTSRPRPYSGADGRGVWAQGWQGFPRTAFLEHRRSSRGGRAQRRVPWDESAPCRRWRWVRWIKPTPRRRGPG